MVAGAVALCAAEGAERAKRARPPQFDKSIRDAFYSDARQKLQGTRPAAAESTAGTPEPAAAPTSQPDTTANAGWSRLLAAEAIEDEVKSLRAELAEAVGTPTAFKGGGFQRAREQLSLLAVLFAIDAQYDGAVRWQKQAAGLRNALARAGLNCKVGTDASYKEAKARADDLETIVGGGTIATTAADDLPWPQVAERGPLMKRLERAMQQGVSAGTANPAALERQAGTLAHEAQLIAALAEVISQPGYEFADDETYLEYAHGMRDQALRLRDAAAKGSYDEARAAAGELSKACSNCHEGYRN
jgi:cytochrome c556